MTTILKSITTLFLIVSATALNAQEKATKKHSHKNKYSIGIMASPDFYLYDFKTHGLSVPTYKVKTNHSFGGTFIYHPFKLITLRIAALYTSKGYSVDYSADASMPDSLSFKSQTINLNYLDIPLMMNLNLIHKDHIQVFLSAGIIPSLLLKKTGETLAQNDNKLPTDLDNISNIFAGITYSFGFKYNLTEWLGLGFEPYFRSYLGKIDSESMDIAPVSFGAKFSTVINFNHY